jgi:hypothetical protein
MSWVRDLWRALVITVVSFLARYSELRTFVFLEYFTVREFVIKVIDYFFSKRWWK